MNENNNTNLDIKVTKYKKSSITMIIILIVSILAILGTTYAIFGGSVNKGSITASANCYNVNYTKGQNIIGELSVGSDYTSGKSTDIKMSANPDCGIMSGTLYITTNNTNTMDLSDGALKYTVVVDGNVVSEGTVNGNANQVIYTGFALNTSDTTYKVYIWLDENLEDISIVENEMYSGFIHADAIFSTTLPDSQLSMLNLGLLDKVENETLTTFTTTSKLDGTTGVYATEDDLGTSYYFRGNVTNNYVKFGKYTEDAYRIITQSNGIWSYSFANTCPESYYGCAKIASAGDDMYWRIVRVNGDGTVRLIYDGIDAFANNDTRKTLYKNAIGYAKYNSLYDDNAYVGYMYGEADSDNYEDTHANINDSDLKKITDAWYEKYIYGKYDNYVADAIYCNDRTRVTDATVNSSLSGLFGWEIYPTGEGYGTFGTLYSVYGRTGENIYEFIPSLKCEQQNDRFTKEDIINGVAGNGMLEYPVGSITADEMILAGGVIWRNATMKNDEMYLFAEDYWFWTMTPSYYNDGYAHAWTGYDGSLSADYVNDFNPNGVRPVISLNKEVLKYGTGTMEDPYRVDYYDDIDNSGANAPAYVENLIPVMYYTDPETSESNWVVADTTSSTSEYGWYDYDSKKWANAVLLTDTKRKSLEKDDTGNYTPGQVIGDSEINLDINGKQEGVLAFYVWIPRYKYKVWNMNKVVGTDTYDAYENGIDIVFENGKTSSGTITCRYRYTRPITLNNEAVELCNDVSDGEGYYTHPAFTFGDDNVTGFWMGKFELSSPDQENINGGGTTTDLAPRILPNVNSWKYNRIFNFWEVIKNMQKVSNDYGLTTDTSIADSHMITNMEWGAVAYLTHSEYGRCNNGSCEEIAYNNSGETINNQNYKTYTGRSAGERHSSSVVVTPAGTYEYHETGGGLASTTGNIYGVYDMSGGAMEYVMALSSSEEKGFKFSYEGNVGDYKYEGNEKYVTTYAYGESYRNQNAYYRGRLGDAVAEVALSEDNNDNGWYNDYTQMFNHAYGFMCRGGSLISENERAGIFNANNSLGGTYFNIGSRAILIGF